ncbi:MAG: uroporphyrinogen-III synthase [Xanthomonadaceae bacterium]|jgi:uroporphyrinogen-III synthase|nr:uroporphyrinogen-III synthase [Xanthomonadaceae bacterium]
MARGKHGPPTLWSLRPAGEHAALRRAAQAAGWRLRVLPLLRTRGCEAGPALAAALACDWRIATSPLAVRRVARLGPWPSTGVDFAVGAGTAAALAAAGARRVLQPARMDSEGLLDLPELAAIGDGPLGLLTAPGGRGLIAATLAARGVRLHLAMVYERRPLHGGARRLAAFAADPGAPLLLSSGEALDRLLERLGPAASVHLGARLLVVPSERLAERLRALGLREPRVAADPRPAALLTALGPPKP